MIIAIESASPDQSVAVADPTGSVVGDAAWTAERGQGSELLPRLLGLLDDHSARLDEVTAVAVGLGPGSFTGLRVGLALAKGLAAGLSVPIIGVPSLETWLTGHPAAVAALVRAGAAEAWVRSREREAPELLPFSALAAARDAELVASSELITALALTRSVAPVGAAATLARLAGERMARGQVDDLAALEPVYLRPPRGLAEATTATVTWL